MKTIFTHRRGRYRYIYTHIHVGKYRRVVIVAVIKRDRYDRINSKIIQNLKKHEVEMLSEVFRKFRKRVAPNK